MCPSTILELSWRYGDARMSSQSVKSIWDSQAEAMWCAPFANLQPVQSNSLFTVEDGDHESQYGYRPHSCAPLFSCPQIHKSVQDQSGVRFSNNSVTLWPLKGIAAVSLGEVEGSQKAKVESFPHQ
jgi:hypothetical protein